MTQEKVDKTSKRADKKSSEDRRKDHPPSKIVIRRLPPSLTPEQFLEQVSPLPSYDFFYYVRADMSLGVNAFTRAYINFQNAEDVFSFRDKFDGYVFVDAKGNDYPAVVEFATFQKVPKKKAKKLDSKKGTIEQDADYKRFLETLQNPESEPTMSIDSYLEELEEKERQNKADNGSKTQTPLLEFLKKRKEERRMAFQKLKEDRRRRELDRRRLKDEERRRHKEVGRDSRDRDRYWEGEKPRDKDRDLRRERGGGDKDAGTERLEEAPKQLMPVKLLKNVEREREREQQEKDPTRPSSGRENLRFSKENRERERAEREKGGKDKNRGSGINKAAKGSGWDEYPGEKGQTRGGGGGHGREDKYASDRPYSGRSERDRDRDRDHRDRDRQGYRTSGGGGKKDNERDRNFRPDRDADRDRLRDREKEKRRDKDSVQPGKRDVEQRGGRRDRSPEAAKRRVEQVPPAADKDKRQVEKSIAEKGRGGKRAEEKDEPYSAAATADPQTEPKAGPRTLEPEDEAKAPGQEGCGDGVGNAKEDRSSREGSEETKAEDDDRKKKRKERPERQIYVPRKALERRQQQQQDGPKGPREESEGSQAKGEGQDKDKGSTGEGQEQEVKAVAPDMAES